MTRAPQLFDAPVPDGVYLSMTDEQYFRQETRGSSDWTTMHFRHEGWWWQSPYNPDRKVPDNKAYTYGHALHAILLEGVAAYDARFAVQPDPADYGDDLVRTTEDCQRVLTEAGFALTSVSKWKKPDWCMAVRQNLPAVPVWDLILADFNDRLGPPGPGRKEVVTAVEDRMLRFMREVATGVDHPDNAPIRQLLLDGAAGFPPLAEVVVLATVGGIRRRWKFDRMFPAFDMDLKSLGNWSGRPLQFATGDAIAKYGMDIQRADYHQGRQAAYALIRAGKVFGGSIEQRKWLATWPDAYPRWDWVWLFYQKPDPKGRAPVLFPVWDDSWSTNDPDLASELRMYGERKLAKAIAFYRQAVSLWGFDKPWARVDPLHYTEERTDGPNIVLPHWIAEEEPTNADAYGGDGEAEQETTANG